MRAIALSALAVLIAGCFHPVDLPPDRTPVDVDSPLRCVNQVCLADPDSTNANLTRKWYGLEQITDDKWIETVFPWLEGDWLAWTVARETSNETRRVSDDLYVYNLHTRELVEVYVGGDRHALFPFIVDDQLAFSYQRMDQGMKIWNLTTHELDDIETGMPGSAKISGFDGNWVVFWNSSPASNETGYWALHLESGERVHLYTPITRNRHSDGTYETVIGAEVSQGRAYYTVTFANAESTRFNLTVYEIDLKTGNRTEFHHDQKGANKMAADYPFVLLEGGLEMVSLDLRSGAFATLTNREEGTCGFPSVGGPWAAFDCGSGGYDRPLAGSWLINLENGTRIQFQEVTEFTGGITVTDGKTVGIQGWPLRPPYQSYHRDLYYASIQDILAGDHEHVRVFHEPIPWDIR